MSDVFFISRRQEKTPELSVWKRCSACSWCQKLKTIDKIRYPREKTLWCTHGLNNDSIFIYLPAVLLKCFWTQIKQIIYESSIASVLKSAGNFWRCHSAIWCFVLSHQVISEKKDACSLLHTLPHLMITSRRDTGLSDRLYALWIIIFLDWLRHRSWHVKIEQTSRIEFKHAALLRMTALVMWLVIWWCKHKGLWRERPEEFSDRSGAVPTERDREWDYLCSEKVYLPLSACPCGVLVLVIKSWQKNSSSNKKTVVNASSVSM